MAKEWSVTVKPNGDEVWHKGGVLHMDGGPAIKRADGSMEWWRNGELHNDNGPAIKNADGSMEWWRNGELHNDNGPAVLTEDEESWVVDGFLHRVDGPAQTFKRSKACVWAIYGILHRDNGPAIENNGNNAWYIYGKQVTEEIHQLYRKNQRKLAFKYFHKWYDCLDDLARPIGQKRMRECIDDIIN